MEVDGLQLWDGAAGIFVGARAVWPQLLPWRDVLVLANDDLRALSHSAAWPAGAPRYTPCTHQVSKAGVSRLSISYELRPAFGASSATWLAEIRGGPKLPAAHQ